jgi:GntR family transcriptional regulator
MLQDVRVGMLDRSSPVPLYYQLAQDIQTRIASGELAVGDRLPSERELGKRFGISRMTVRQAITYLERLGLVKTQQGVGTLVDEPRVVYDVAMLFGFVGELVIDEKRAQVRLLQQQLVKPRPKVAVALGLNTSDQVLTIRRIRIFKGTPLVLETNCFPAALCQGLEMEDLGESSLTSLRRKYNLLTPRARHSMVATIADETEADLLRVPIGAPLLRTEGETYSEGNQPVEYFKVLYRGDRFRFETSSDGGTLLHLR